MPKVYSKEKREELEKEILSVGFTLIKLYGLKKMNIETITKKVGIAQGTFYNFFTSKEMLVYELAKQYQDKIDKIAKDIIESRGFFERADLQQIYLNIILRDEDNIYHYLLPEDLKTLSNRLTKSNYLKLVDTYDRLEKNILYVKNKKEFIDTNAIINWIQIMNLTVINKSMLVECDLENIILKLINLMLDEIFLT